ncbi:MAG: hypothetical protein ACREH8_24320 [Opitutaceae bacterium]
MIKYLPATVALIAAAAGATWFVSYRMAARPAVRQAVQKRDALEWLRRDFDLNDAQFAAVKQLHESYAVVCEDHCRAIQDATRRRATLKAQTLHDPAALAVAEQKLQELRLICENAIATHVREVAAQMSQEQGRRYLALVLPKIKDFDHQGAADLRVEHRH